MNEKEKKRVDNLVKSGKKLSAYFDRELPERELGEVDWFLRSMRNNQSLDSSVGEMSEFSSLEDWREIRGVLRNWHAEEMRHYDREQIGGKLWNSISANITRELESRKESRIICLRRALFQLPVEIRKIFNSIFAFCVRDSYAVGACGLVLALVLVYQIGSELSVQGVASLEESAGYLDSVQTASSSQNSNEEPGFATAPNLVLGRGGVVQFGSSYGGGVSAFVSRRSHPGITRVGETRRFSNHRSEGLAVEDKGRIVGHAFGSLVRDMPYISEFPSVDVDGIGWDGGRGQDVRLLESSKRDKSPMVRFVNR